MTNFSFFNISVTNITDHEPPQMTVTWTTVPIFTTITFATGLLLNGALLLLFALDRSLRTPFNIYLMNLLLANFLVVLIQYPLDILSNLYSLYWFMGEDVCTLYLYTSWVIEAGIFNAHQLIAFNRIWAAFHPHSYRAIHSTKTAIICCLLMWIYVQAAVVPGWTADFLYYRLPVRKSGCRINLAGWPRWGLTMHFLIFDLPQVTMVLTFPAILCRQIARRRTLRTRQIAGEGPANPHVSGFSVSCNRVLERLPSNVKNDPPEMTGSKSATAHDDAVNMTLKVTLAEKTVKQRSSHGYLLLALLSVSVTICWTPVDIYYILSSFVPSYNEPLYYSVATMIFSCQTSLDPILFAMALESIRKSFHRVFCRCSGYTASLVGV